MSAIRTLLLGVLAAAVAVAVTLALGPTTTDDGTRTVPAAAPTSTTPSASPTSAAPTASRTATTAPRSPAGRRVAAAKDTTAVPARSGTGRRVVYSVQRQRVWTVRADGRVARTYLVSGQDWQPDPGTFSVYSRSRHTASSVSAETMEYMVRFTHGKNTGAPIGFHTIPIDYSGQPAQTERQLGKALSAGCIRQRRADAAYLWDFAPVGTKVVVVS